MTSKSGYRPVLMVLANAEAAGLTVSVSLDGAWMTATDDSLMSFFVISNTACAASDTLRVPEGSPRYEVRVSERNSLTFNCASEPEPEV